MSWDSADDHRREGPAIRTMNLELSSLHKKPSPDLKLPSPKSRSEAEQLSGPREPPVPLVISNKYLLNVTMCCLGYISEQTKDPSP